MAKEKLRKPFFRTFLGNLVIVIILCIALYWIFFGSLSIITRHGEISTVPDLKGMKLDTALQILEKQGFDYKIDSTYDKGFGLNEIMDQQPEAGYKAKSGRIIFLTVNKANPPLIEMPNLVSLSLRSADILLKKNSLSIGDTVFIYDIAEGTILEQRFKGQVIPSGTRIPEGSAIDITVSKGLSDETTNIPDLIGMKFKEAIQTLEEKELRFSIVYNGKITDSATALVYSQYPEGRNEYGEPLRVYKGDHIEVRVAQNPTIEKRQYIPRPKTSDSLNDDGADGSDNTRPSHQQSPLPPPYPNTNNNSNKDKPKQSSKDAEDKSGKDGSGGKQRPRRPG